MDEPRFGYMCKIDYDWELGEALGGSTIYASLDDLKENHKCYENCGVIKVTINMIEEIIPEKPWGSDEKE